MKINVNKILKLAGSVDRMISPSDKLSELIKTAAARYDDELLEDELELVAAARKVPDRSTDRLN